MPLYEYICDQDGTVIELLRPMREADAPVPDPDGRGRTFRRKLSSFQAKSAMMRSEALPQAGCCPCGKPGGCGMA